MRVPASVVLGVLLVSVCVSAPARAAGVLHIDTSPPGAQIAVDGKQTPALTPAQLNLPVGAHKVTLIKKGYVVQTRRVAITKGQVQRIHLTLPISLSDQKLMRVATASHKGQGTVVVVTSAPGARIFMNGRDTKLVTPATFKTDSGYYVMRLVHTGASVSRALVVAQNQETVIQVPLSPTRVATPNGAPPSRPAAAATPAAETSTPPDDPPAEAAPARRPRVAEADWPAYRARCLQLYCQRERYVPVCDQHLTRCSQGCPGLVNGKVVNAGAYYSCADVCKNNRRVCVESNLSACIKHCNTRP